MKACEYLIRTIAALVFANIQCLSQSIYAPYTFSTLAGGADPGSEYGLQSGAADGIGSAARFSHPYGITVDKTGTLYVADFNNSTIRKITSSGVVTTFAGLAGTGGSTDATGIDARFSGPTGVALDSSGNLVVADGGNNTIRKVTPEGVVTTVAGLALVDQRGNAIVGSADGMGGDARFNFPMGVAVDSADNIYVSDYANHTIRKVTPTGLVTTLAGLAGQGGSADGTGSEARFGSPFGVAVDRSSNIYVADSANDTIRKITPAGVVTTVAGRTGIWYNFVVVGINGYFVSPVDGIGSDARFHAPHGIAVDGADNVYVTEYFNNTIRKIMSTGVVATLAGQPEYDNLGNPVIGGADGTGSAARFFKPSGVAVDNLGNVYVADSYNDKIRKGYPTPRFLSSSNDFHFSSGHFDSILTGPTGRLVIVESSTDLASWVPIWTNSFANDLKFSDAQSGVHSNRFYRARLP